MPDVPLSKIYSAEELSSNDSTINDHVFSERAVGRALVICPVIRSPASTTSVERSPEARLEEARGLAEAIGLTVALAETIRLARPRPATLLGKGIVENFSGRIADADITLVVVDSSVTPVQQRNLEKAWNCKVIDRTGLILEIFGSRARTYEGRLQVELAALSYQRSRLVRSWTHLERQRGGFGFLGGPGESQLEIDRRLIGERIAKLKKELEHVKRTRELHRKARTRVPYPIVALVGYTNAGKSTLFNRLTHSKVLAKDILFATLDPTMRSLELPSGRKAILSDTVGFISDLPTHLVAAFRATLEEVEHADIIVHVRDVSHPDTEAQHDDVHAVLADLGLSQALNDGMIEARNKIDLLTGEPLEALHNRTDAAADTVAISARTGEGCDALAALLDRRLEHAKGAVSLDIDLSDGAGLAWIYRNGNVIERQDDEQMAHLTVAMSQSALDRFAARLREGEGAKQQFQLQ